MTRTTKSKKKVRVRAARGTIYPSFGAYRAELTVEGVRARRTFPTEEEAQLWLEQQVKLSTRYGISLDKARVTVPQLVDLVLETKELENRKPTTLRDYRNSGRYMKNAWPELPVQHLTADHLTHLYAQLRRTLNPKTVRNVHGFVHLALDFAVARGVTDRNVADIVKPPSWQQEPPKAYGPDEVAAFTRAVAGDRLEAFWLVCLATGMRVGELCALKWGDVDLQTGQVLVRRRLVRVGGVVDVGAPKTRAGQRVVHLPAPVLAKLRHWQAVQELERRAAGPRWIEGSDWVFTTWKGNTRGGHAAGNHLDARWLLGKLHKLQEKAGLADLTIHGLRHTFATLMLANNAPLKDVQEVLGHAKPSHTLNLYWQSVPGASERLAGKAAEVLFGGGDAPPEPPADAEEAPAPKAERGRHLRLVKGA